MCRSSSPEIPPHPLPTAKAAQYFNKIQCFCFEEQRLEPNEEGEREGSLPPVDLVVVVGMLVAGMPLACQRSLSNISHPPTITHPHTHTHTHTHIMRQWTCPCTFSWTQNSPWTRGWRTSRRSRYTTPFSAPSTSSTLRCSQWQYIHSTCLQHPSPVYLCVLQARMHTRQRAPVSISTSERVRESGNPLTQTSPWWRT